MGASSRNLPLRAKITVAAEPLPLPEPHRQTLGDLLCRAETEEQKQKILHLAGALGDSLESLSGDTDATAMVSAMIDALPLHSVVSFSNATEAEIRRARESVAR